VGDMNVAHNEIDLRNPETNRNKTAGFTDQEREDFTKLLEEDKVQFGVMRIVCVDNKQQTGMGKKVAGVIKYAGITFIGKKVPAMVKFKVSSKFKQKTLLRYSAWFFTAPLDLGKQHWRPRWPWIVNIRISNSAVPTTWLASTSR